MLYLRKGLVHLTFQRMTFLWNQSLVQSWYWYYCWWMDQTSCPAHSVLHTCLLLQWTHQQQTPLAQSQSWTLPVAVTELWFNTRKTFRNCNGASNFKHSCWHLGFWFPLYYWKYLYWSTWGSKLKTQRVDRSTFLSTYTLSPFSVNENTLFIAEVHLSNPVSLQALLSNKHKSYLNLPFTCWPADVCAAKALNPPDEAGGDPKASKKFDCCCGCAAGGGCCCGGGVPNAANAGCDCWTGCATVDPKGSNVFWVGAAGWAPNALNEPKPPCWGGDPNWPGI